jgi:hypothetical protein
MKISPQAMNWMGARELLAMWRPVSEAGADQARQWPLLSEPAWMEERRCCLLLDAALEGGLVDEAALGDLLRELPSLAGALASLQSGGGAETALLFRVKQVLFAVLELLPKIAAVAGYPQVASSGIREAYAVLHTAGDPAARFVLSAGRSPTLAEARSAELAGQRALLQARGAGGSAAELEALQRSHEQLRQRLLEVEGQVLTSVADALRPHAGAISEAAAWVTELDLRLAKCLLRRAWKGCWPEPAATLAVAEGWHPVVAARLAGRGGGFVSQSFALPAGVSMLTGANMGGKSVALQLAGLVLLCGASGLPAPARSATFARVDFVEVVAGQEQGSRHGLSSFGSEVMAWRALLERSGSGFVLADEPARTTSPADGAALLEGLIAAVAARGWHGWFATHFGEAGQGIAASAWAVRGLREIASEEGAASEGSLAALESRMDYRLVPADGAAASDALRVAAQLGLGEEVLGIARQVRARSESGRSRSS